MIKKTVLLIIISCIALMPAGASAYSQTGIVNILEAVSIPQVPFRGALNLSVCSSLMAGGTYDKIILIRSLNHLNRPINNGLVNKLLQDSSIAVKIEAVKYIYSRLITGSNISHEVKETLTGLYDHRNSVLDHYLNTLSVLALDMDELPFDMKSGQSGRVNYIEITALKGIEIDTMQMTQSEMNLYRVIKSQGSNSD
ncbi:MAG: hypothetical protein R6U31_01010 [bacterium]